MASRALAVLVVFGIVLVSMEAPLLSDCPAQRMASFGTVQACVPIGKRKQRNGMTAKLRLSSVPQHDRFTFLHDVEFLSHLVLRAFNYW